MLLCEVCGYSEEAGGYDRADYRIYRNDRAVALVTDSTNYLDSAGNAGDVYTVAPVLNGRRGGRPVSRLTYGEREYLDIPIQKPEDGVTPRGERYTYSANDMSVSDVDGDGSMSIL